MFCLFDIIFFCSDESTRTIGTVQMFYRSGGFCCSFLFTYPISHSSNPWVLPVRSQRLLHVQPEAHLHIVIEDSMNFFWHTFKLHLKCCRKLILLDKIKVLCHNKKLNVWNQEKQHKVVIVVLYCLFPCLVFKSWL